MAPGALSLLSLALTMAAGIALVDAQANTFPKVPLVSKHFAYPSQIPYKVDTSVGLARGTQAGYNICNSTTENQGSMCQTSFFNGIDDFCLWAPSVPGQAVGQIEGAMVAWCSKPGHGTRLIPPGTLTGLQFLKTPDYIQLVGFLDQTKIAMMRGDNGGEMDPHGSDLRGNPIGGLIYSNAFTRNFTQVIEWTNFMGGNAFCLKACDPSLPNAALHCAHIYDRVGCAYNAPNAAPDGVFVSCAADSADPPGVYKSVSAGKTVTKTYTQPPESLGAISSIPYTARVPKSSACRTYGSAQLFNAQATATSSLAASASRSTSGTVASTSFRSKITPTAVITGVLPVTTVRATTTTGKASATAGVNAKKSGAWRLQVDESAVLAVLAVLLGVLFGGLLA